MTSLIFFRYHKNRIYVIDVSQAVEHDHPNALLFLRQDCHAITEFFVRKNCVTLTVRELFDFVTDVSLTDANVDDYIVKMLGTLQPHTIFLSPPFLLFFRLIIYKSLLRIDRRLRPSNK